VEEVLVQVFGSGTAGSGNTPSTAPSQGNDGGALLLVQLQVVEVEVVLLVLVVIGTGVTGGAGGNGYCYLL
jgi:hypothetical protein